MAGSLSEFDFTQGFCLLNNEKHWSNENGTIYLIDNIQVPKVEKVKEKKPSSLLKWDTFKA